MSYTQDTIVAAATPPGTGGVGVVRISGPDVERIGRAMLGSLPEPRTATYRAFRGKNGTEIDTGIALYFPGPASFTGESVLVMALLVDVAIELGARQAESGEFTKRAFLNGKLDLAQAEAIADLIESGTEQAARAALRSLSGEFSEAVNALAEKLIRLRMHVEAAIDFPEEEIDFLSDAALLARLEDCGTEFESLRKRARIGRVLRDGYHVVIVGKPNAGKSSLLNRLSGEESAIVTEIAGMTRDILREQINIEGLAVELIDTAGIRENPDRIEEEGIRRAREALKKADAGIQDATDEQLAVLDESVPDDAPVIVVHNKIDLLGEPPGADHDVVRLSARTGEGIDVLRTKLRQLAGYRDLGEGAFTARRRHLDALRRAARHFEAGRTALDETRAGELLAEELRLAQEALGQITGAVSSDDLLGRIFADFCIGK
jgi:tRNA modification GTPase